MKGVYVGFAPVPTVKPLDSEKSPLPVFGIHFNEPRIRHVQPGGFRHEGIGIFHPFRINIPFPLPLLHSFGVKTFEATGHPSRFLK